MQNSSGTSLRSSKSAKRLAAIFAFVAGLSTSAHSLKADTCSFGGGCPTGYPFYTQPTAQTVCTGGTAQFTVAPSFADGTPPYAWQISIDGGFSWFHARDLDFFAPDSPEPTGTSTDTMTVTNVGAGYSTANFRRAVPRCVSFVGVSPTRQGVAPAGSNRSGDESNAIVEAFDGKDQDVITRACRP